MIFIFSYGFLPDGKLISTITQKADFSIIMNWRNDSLMVSFPEIIKKQPKIETFCERYFTPVLNKYFSCFKKNNETGIITIVQIPIKMDDEVLLNCMLTDLERTPINEYNTIQSTECNAKTKSGRKKKETTSAKKIVSSKKVSSHFFDNFEFIEKDNATIVKRSNNDADDSIIHINFPIPSGVRDEWKKFFDRYNLKWGKGIAIAIEYLIEQTEKGNVVFK